MLVATLFFSCTNDIKEVRDFLQDKNLPIGVSKDIYTVYKDSGRISTILRSPIFNDYSNRKEHPFSEFPNGIYITKINKNLDSTSIIGKYAISYTKTEISEIRGNVIVNNYAKKYKLYTEQLFWDQKEHYFVTEKKFTLITPSDTLYGVGFESSEDLSNWQAKNNSGSISVSE
jgi:LPS export ABC transporter protein LptC